MKEQYQELEVEIIRFDNEDVISNSPPKKVIEEEEED